MAKRENLVEALGPFFGHVQVMGNKLKCPVCLNLLQVAQMIIPCGHLVCRVCLPIGESLACPACDQNFLSKDVRPAVHAEELIEIFHEFNHAKDDIINMSHHHNTSAQNPNPSGKDGSNSSRLNDTSRETKYEIPDFVREKVEEVRKRFRIHKLGRVMRVAGELCWNKWEIEPVVEQLYQEFNKIDKKGLATKKRVNDMATLLAEKFKGVDYNFPPREIISPQDMWFYESSQKGRAEKRPIGQPSSLPSTENRSEISARVSTRQVKRSQTRQGTPQPSSPTVRNKLTNDCETDGSTSSDSCIEIGKENFDGVKRCKVDKAKRQDINMRASSIVCEDECVFCHSFRTTKSYGPIVCYVNGILVKPKEVAEDEENAIYVHKKCLDWAPRVYYAGDQVKNLEKEIKRGDMLLCSKCGLHGAVLGCFYAHCKNTFHATCAIDLPGCRWDTENYNMLCPAHASKKLRNFMDAPQEQYSSKQKEFLMKDE